MIVGGDGFQSRHDTGDPHIVYGTSQEGNLTRFDRRTGRGQGIRANFNTAPYMWAEPGAPATPPPAPPAGGAPGAGRGGGGQGAGRGGGGGGDRANWDTPYTTSNHSPTRLYWATQYVYRTDDRGASWKRISPDLSRNLNWQELPIMGKVWPQGSIALHESTTALSNVVSIDESPRWEDLLIVGTDDGLIQITENGGRNWTKIEDFPGVPKYTYVTDVFLSPTDVNVVYATLGNWQRGDYKPYVVKSIDRGKTWTNITGNLPDKHVAWTIAQDHIAPNLLFLGTEFGLWFSVDGGAKWVQLKGGMPPTQVRDLHLQKRESDVVMGTFGRGFWILDDYSALREVSAQTMGEDVRLFPTRDRAFRFQPWGVAQPGSAGLATLGGNYTMPNPPQGAAITYHVRQNLPDDQRLVVDIFEGNGTTRVRRIELTKTAGLHRTYWNLMNDGPAGGGAAPGGGRGGGGGAGGGGAQFGGRGGGGGTAATPGRYRLVIGRLQGDTFTAIGQPQFVNVIEMPEQNYRLYR